MKPRPPDKSMIGRKVRAYLNLHLLGMLSVMSDQGGDKGRVICHAGAIELRGCTFRVSEAGRLRVLREHQKNVHAFACGTLVRVFGRIVPESLQSQAEAMEANGGAVLDYSPYRTTSFVNAATGQRVDRAARVIAIGKRIVAEEVS